MKSAINYLSLLTASLLILGCEKNITSVDTSQPVETLAKKGQCVTIQEGIIKYSTGHYLAGQSLTTGFDIFGYNYQAHLFRGSYANVYLGGDGFPPYGGNDDAYLAAHPSAATKWYWPYRTTKLEMKWNDAWLSNMDCDGDGKLDRYFGFSSYIGSGAWETNHMYDEYYVDGKKCTWTYFVKIVAAPADAHKVGGFWYNSSGVEIGPVIWGSFATIQSVYNDPCAGFHGVEYLSPAGPGFGKY